MTSTRSHKYIFSIWYAARHGRLERIEELCEREGSKNNIINALDTTHNDLTPLHWAAKFGHEDVCRWLLLHGANPSAVAKDGNTPLHLAAGNATIKIVRLLLEYASEPRMKNAKGDLPADVAKTYCRWDSEDLLRRWEPCGGFPDLRNSGFEFQRMTDHELRFTLPLPEPPPKPPRKLEWMTPTEATTEEERRKVRKEIKRQKEVLMLKENSLGKGVVTASVGISLLRVARLLRSLGEEGEKEALEALRRSTAIFERLHRQAQVNLSGGKSDDPVLSTSESVNTGTFDTTIESGAGEEQNADDLIPLVDKQVDPAHNGEEIEGGIQMSHGNRKALANQRADEYASVLQELASLCVKIDRLEEAEKNAKKASNVLSVNISEDNMELAGALTNLALILRERRKRYIEHHKNDTRHKLKHEEHAKELKKEMMSTFVRALTIVENRLGPNHIDVSELLGHIANIYSAEGKYMQAAALLERKLEIVGIGIPQTEEHAKSYDELAQVYFLLKQFELSESLFENALKIRENLHETKMTPKIDSPEESGLDDDRFDDNKQTVPIVDIGTEEGDSMSLSNSNSVAKSSTSKSLGYALFLSYSLLHLRLLLRNWFIMRVDVGTSEGKKLVVTEEDKRRIPFSKGYRRPKKEDLVYESVQEIHPSIQRTFNNIAIASNNKIKKNRIERRKYRNAVKSYKVKVNRARRLDDMRYLRERPHRQEKGVYSASVGKQDSSISRRLDFHDNKDVGDDGVRNFEVPTAYHTPYDEVQKIKS
eukprot:g10364.t1